MKSINQNEVSWIAGGAEAPYGSDGTGEDFSREDTSTRDLFDAFCEGLGNLAGLAVEAGVARVNPAAAIPAGQLANQGVAACCSNASIDTCLGKSPPPPPDHRNGGAGATGDW